ncbi:MAG: CHASE3 domain-containing protein [Syntrophobacteraceae bacterium]|nr:CHASE3 domain-containing protein [Syntrophobacteraceae bacterium]
MKIRWLLFPGFASLVVIFAVLLTAVYLEGAKMLDTKEIVAQTDKIIAKVEALRADLLHMEVDEMSFAIFGGKPFLEHLQLDVRVIQNERTAIGRLISNSPEERKAIDAFKGQYRNWLQTEVQPLIALRQEVDRGVIPLKTVVDFVKSAEGMPQVKAMRRTLSQIEHDEFSLLERRRAALTYFTNLARQVIIFGSGAGILLSLLITFLTARKITGPLEELASYAGRVSAGNYPLELKLQRKGEIGVLADALRSMVTRLADHIAFRKQQTEILENTAAELRAEIERRDELELRLKEREAELQNANEHLRRLPSMLIAAQEEERKRISSELHDSVGQVLVASKVRIEYILNRLQAGNSEEAFHAAEEFIPTIQLSIDETRAIYMGLRPTVLEDFGAIAALAWYRDELMKVHPKLHIEMDIEIDEAQIPKYLVVPIFRIAQEALNNVSRHSDAEWVDVRLSRDGAAIELSISHDGQGTDYDLKTGEPRSLAILSMMERAKPGGGNLTIESTHGDETTIRVRWRIDEAGKWESD